MSIRGAVQELNKEIQRITDIRDALMHAETDRVNQQVRVSLTKAADKAPVRRRTAVVTPERTPAKTSAPKKATSKRKLATKRIVSEATRKKMSDAAKARSAAQKAD